MADRRQAYMATAFTIAMGLLFINGMTFSWKQLGLAAGDSPYATGMYAVTITHALLVVAAIATFVVVGFRVYAGRFEPRDTEPVTAAVIVWHFVVLSGLVIWWTLWFVEGGPG
jgi:heme/copper-type cytochrome/quinol oxidase subunit 3